jgi:uncharacterized protein YbjT (DUF2867 family)
MTTLLLVGSTGLVGQEVLEQALADPRVSRLVAPTRRPLPARARLFNPVVDFARLPEDATWWAVDAVICTLGTTLRAAGSQAAFYAVDHGLPLACGRLALQHGARTCAFNSALGADPGSRVFYSRTKGDVERDLSALGFHSLTLVRPGLIGGDRQEHRPAERAALLVSQWMAPVLPRRYRVVPAERIAHHLLQAALAGEAGTRILMPEQLL